MKRYLRGFALIAISLAALSVLISTAYQQAQMVADQIVSGQIPLESEAISDAISDGVTGTTGLTDDIVGYVLVACWLIGIVDAWRLGNALDKKTREASDGGGPA